MPDEQGLPYLADSTTEVTIKNELADGSFLLHPSGDTSIGLLPESKSEGGCSQTPVKEELKPPLEAPPGDKFSNYVTAADITYSPEGSIEEVLQMSAAIATSIKELRLGTHLNRRVWLRDINRYKKRRIPCTTIAVCGPTGAGKSTMLNALLGVAILPTSPISACTAVVTEIGYHKRSDIVAKVEFFNRSQWEEELKLLLGDLVDKHGGITGPSNFTEDQEIAWRKVHTVYPHLEREKLMAMAPADIIDEDPVIAQMLGKGHPVVGENSEVFGAAIAKFIDSGDEQDGNTKYWPLIRRVQIWTKSEVLSCGAVLVDLPGNGDANPVRNRIARNYMKNARYIWIVAPILRPTDDKGVHTLLNDAYRAQLLSKPVLFKLVGTILVDFVSTPTVLVDGSYNANNITFVATKSDDADRTEIIKACWLKTDASFLQIESRINEVKLQCQVAYSERTRIEDAIEEESKRSKELESDIEECRIQLTALGAKNFEHAPDTSKPDSLASETKKRGCGAGGRSAKVPRVEGQPFEPMDIASKSPADDAAKDSYAIAGWKGLFGNAQKDRRAAVNRLQQYQQQYYKAVARSEEYDNLATKLDKEKTALCAMKRNKLAVSGETNHTGNPGAIEPGLPRVFACSSRDFIRLQYNTGDKPDTFINPADTEIPALQDWCRKLTIAARQQSAQWLVADLTRVVHSIRPFADKWDDENTSAHAALAALWETSRNSNRNPNPDALDFEAQAETSWTQQHHDQDGMVWEGLRHGRSSLEEMAEQAQEALAEDWIPGAESEKGLSVHLRTRLYKVAGDYAQYLKDTFRNELQAICNSGAEKANLAAVKASDEFAASARWWQTYRAILRRHGEYKDFDLNMRLVEPMLSTVALPWARLFGSESILFKPLAQATMEGMFDLLETVVATTPEGIREASVARCEHALMEGLELFETLQAGIKARLAEEQKDVSRSLVAHVKHKLKDGYESAGRIRGDRTSERLKQTMHDCVAAHRETLFSDASRTLFRELDKAADEIEWILRLAFTEIAEKIEVNVSAMWDMSVRDKALAKKRQRFVEQIHTVLHQLKLWTDAGKTWENMGGAGHVEMQG